MVERCDYTYEQFRYNVRQIILEELVGLAEQFLGAVKSRIDPVQGDGMAVAEKNSALWQSGQPVAYQYSLLFMTGPFGIGMPAKGTYTSVSIMS